MTVEQIQVMSFTELETKALGAKVAIARHYEGAKLDFPTFSQLKGIETIYNLRSWNEGEKIGPSKLNRQAKKLAKGN